MKLIRHSRICTSFLLGTTIFIIVGCVAPESSPANAVLFETLAESSGRVKLEEPPGFHLSNLRNIDVDPDGRILIADQMQHKLYMYSAEGDLLHAVGRAGSGPGEFDNPADALFGPEGKIFAADAGNLRIQRLSSALEFDTLFHIPNVAGVTSLAALDDEVVVHVHTRMREAPKFYRVSADGEPRGRFHREHPLYDEVPYWRTRDDRLVVGRTAIFAVGDKTYPIYRYNRRGERVDSIGSPPPSWIPAPRPQRGEFANMSPDRIGEWMRSHTWIDNLAIYQDTLLLVSHGRYNPNELAYLEDFYTIDLYKFDGDKLLEDIELPGRMLHAAEHIYLLDSSPPDSWVIQRFVMDLS